MVDFKDIVDKLLYHQDDWTYKDFMYPTGTARRVYAIGDYVYKLSNITDEYNQNKKENEVWLANKDSSLLCPIVCYYNDVDVIVMKKLESDRIKKEEFCQQLYGCNFKNYIQNVIIKEIEKVSDSNNLDLYDLKSIPNWGFDMQTKTFKLVDYGFAKKNRR